MRGLIGERRKQLTTDKHLNQILIMEKSPSEGGHLGSFHRSAHYRPTLYILASQYSTYVLVFWLLFLIASWSAVGCETGTITET